MTKIIANKVKCCKCEAESEQIIVYSINFSLGNKQSNKKLMTHKQKCPYCGYEAIEINKDDSK